MEPVPSLETHRDIILDQILTGIGNDIYATSGVFEDLENAGYITGGHHLRQQLAAYAQKLIYDAWVKPQESILDNSDTSTE